jgi:GT2 family glycosyltransferase
MTMRIAVVVATRGRGELLAHLLRNLESQSRPPDVVCISGVEESDVRCARAASSLPLRVVLGREGLTAQRNAGVQAIIGVVDAVAFFDDDFLPSKNWLQRLESILTGHPMILGIMGNTLADGGSGAAIDLAHAQRMLRDHDAVDASATNEVQPIEKLYGCNMAYRASLFGSLQFDERLPLFGWLEDSDFSYRVRALGPIVTARDLWGVHLGVKSGKISDIRFGVSQVVNPVYLYAKGSVPLRAAAGMLLRPLLKNLMKVFRPEPYINRRDRLRGNILGLKHILSGRIDPAMILELEK